MPVVPALGRKEKDQEFKVILQYTVNLKSAWATKQKQPTTKVYATGRKKKQIKINSKTEYVIDTNMGGNSISCVIRIALI